jgi:ABC-type lipoprotein export system ATPase subunit
MSEAVEVRDAFRIYTSAAGAAVALQGLNLVVDEGEIVVALGPSGSGKTTLLRVVGGFEGLSAGSVSVFGTQLSRLGEKAMARFRAANLGFLDQHYGRALSPTLSCRETVSLQLELVGREPRASRRIADELLERLGLLDRRNEPPQALSGGEQQQVALCAAIAHRPKLLLADEPVGELDAESASTVYAILSEMARDAGMSVVVVSHDLGAETIADRVVTISEGRVVDESRPGTPTALVVSRGWIRVPTPELRELGEPSRMSLELRREELALTAVADRPRAGGKWGLPANDPAPAGERADRMETTVAELRQVVKAYGTGDATRVVFENLSHRIAAGSFVVVVGRSGTGKTTFLHLLAGLERPSAGDIVLLELSLTGLDRSQLALIRRRHVSLVTQEPGLVPYLSAAENLMLGLQLRAERSVRRESVDEALAAVGLDERLKHRASSLSAGERQRVAVARALLADAELVLVDEPTACLDRENGRLVGQLLARAAYEKGVAVVCATHDPALIELADEVIQLGARRRRPAPQRPRPC